MHQGDRTMLMLNPFLFNALNDFVEQGDRTMLMLNYSRFGFRNGSIRQGDRTMLMLNLQNQNHRLSFHPKETVQC